MTTNLTKLASLAIMALAATTSITSALEGIHLVPGPNNFPDKVQHSTILECRVKDDNFWIMNFGNGNLDSGLQISWRSPTTNDEGVILLPKMLAPGDEVKLAGILSGDANAGAPCTATLA